MDKTAKSQQRAAEIRFECTSQEKCSLTQPTKSLWATLGSQGGNFQGVYVLAAPEAFSRGVVWAPEDVVGQN